MTGGTRSTPIKGSSPARSIADTTGGTIVASVDIAAPPERVYRALTTPEELVRWWGGEQPYRTTGWHHELRVGGTWKATGQNNDGSSFSVEGEYPELAPPHRLVYSWRPSWDQSEVTRVSYSIESIEGGTHLTVRHEGFTNKASCNNHAQGWTLVLGWLAGHVQPAADSAARMAPS